MLSPTSNSAVRESAPYGHACIGCSKAKCRCIGRGTGMNTCERCRRLNKTCEPASTGRKRLARRPATKTARLEEKLDDLVTLLKTQATASNASLQDASRVHESASSEANSATHEHRRIVSSHRDRAASPASVTDFVTLPTPSELSMPYPSNPLSSNGPSVAQAEEYLKTFRRFHMQAFPFVYIPPEVTAVQLKSERPFLWLNIRAFCCRSTVERSRLERTIREILSQSLLVDLDRSLDLLLGLLAYLTWTMDYGKGKKMLCAYSSLAASLVFDLRLDRPSQEVPCRELESYKSFSYPIKQYVATKHRTNEERRAVLACFAICSTISSFLKSQPMRWTPYMEDCLQYLAEQPGVVGDEILVAIVKCSKIVDDVTSACCPRFFASERNLAPNVPLILHVKPMLTNFESVKASIRPELLENKIIKSYLCDTCIMINELPLCGAQHSARLPGQAEFGRVECFYSCIKAAKEGLENWLSFTQEELFGASMPLLLHFGRNTHGLYRLAMTESPLWDRQAVQSYVDLIKILERGAELVGSVPERVGLQTDGSDFFSRSAVTLSSAIPIWKRALAESHATPGAAAERQGDAAVENTAPVPEELMGMDLAEDTWLSDMFTSWVDY